MYQIMIIILHALMIYQGCQLYTITGKNRMIENAYYLTRFGEPILHHVTIFDIIKNCVTPLLHEPLM